MTAATRPIKVFYSYAHEDETLRKTLETHLSQLKRQGVIEEWHDRCITPGQEWAKAIDHNLESADLILLLVSADFLKSDYCYGVELRRAMERYEAGEARVIPVILRDVDWTGAPFSKLQCLPTGARPVTSWFNQDEAFANIARGIRRAIEEAPLLAPTIPPVDSSQNIHVGPAFCLIQFIYLNPVYTILGAYFLQVFLVAFWPPLELFGPNWLRDWFAFGIFAPFGSPTNYHLAGVLTYFKQLIIYLSFLLYFLFFNQRLGDVGKQKEEEIRRQVYWGSRRPRTVLALCVIGIWGYRYFIANGEEEAFWGPVGMGLFSGFYKFIADPIINWRYLFVFLYRFIETGSYLLLSLVAAITLPTFFKLGQARKSSSKDLTSETKVIYETTGKFIHRSITFFLPILLIWSLVYISKTIKVGELNPKLLHIWLITFLLISIFFYGLYDLSKSIGALSSEEKVGRMFWWYIAPIIISFVAVIWGVQYLFSSFLTSPEHQVEALESEIMNTFGSIFKRNLEKREEFRKQLRELVEREFIKPKYQNKNYCDQMNVDSVNNLTPDKKYNVQLICLEAQVAIYYSLNQLPELLGGNWRQTVSTFRTDICDPKIDSQYELNKLKNKLDKFKNQPNSLEELDHFGKVTFHRISNLSNNLSNIKPISLDCDGLHVYEEIEQELKYEFDQYVGGIHSKG